MADSRTMTFRRIGPARHMRIETPEDLAGVLELDEAHWVATGAPIDSINCDATFLTHCDTDRNGRLMCFEIKGAITWLLRNLHDHAGIADGNTALALEAINTDQDEGRQIRQSAEKILTRLGAADARHVTLDQVRRIKGQVEGRAVSEAGVVLPAAAADEVTRRFIADAIGTVGGAPHPGGGQGITEAHLDEFLGAARAYLAWRALGEVPHGRETSEVMPLGAETPAAFAALGAVREKVDQYFAQCRAAALDARLAEWFAAGEAAPAEMDLSSPEAIEQVLAGAPLARPTPRRVLAFDGEVNPHYAEALAAFRQRAVAPVLGGPAGALSEAQWEQVKAFYAAHASWAAAKAGAAVEGLGAETLRAYLDDKHAAAVRSLIAQSTTTAFVLDNIRLTERLVLYQAYMLPLANNFVSFPHLYDADCRAMFEMGTLIMDGRHFNFTIRVTNRAEHSRIAATSNMYVLYVEVLPKEGREGFEVAAPVTSGGKGNLCVGKRGLFRDIHGTEYDARVVSIIENPISLWEAFVSPFRRIGQIITGRIEAMTTEAEKKLDTRTTAAVATVRAGQAAPDAKGSQPEAEAAPGGLSGRGGLLMGGGIAIAALGSAAAFITKTLSEVAWWQILIGIGGAVLAVILPTSILGFLKLRKRDLSAILEGSGWAINARMRLKRKQSRFFTRTPRYPPGAKRTWRPWG